MKRSVAAALAAMPFVLSTLDTADAAVVLSYTSANAPQLAAAAVGTDVTAAALTRGSGLTNAGASFASTGYNFTSEAAAVSGGDFLSFGFTSANPYDLTSIDFGYSRSGQGPMQLALGVSVNGGAYQSLFVDNSVLNSGESANVALAGLTGVTQATFYLSGWFNSTPSANQINNGQFRLDNLFSSGTAAIVLSGDIVLPPPPQVEEPGQPAPVPLPAGLPLLAAALGLARMTFRRSKS